MRLSFCSANLRNPSPRCRLSSSYNVFLRHFGMNTIWYLHSHLVWLKAFHLVHRELPFVCFGGSRLGVSAMDSWICQTPTASPAEPRGLPTDRFWTASE